MNPKLSDRIAQASDDVLQKLFQTEFVQKMLMTGQLDDRNRKAVLRQLKALYDTLEYSKSAKQLNQMKGLTADEKEFFARVEGIADQTYGSLFNELEQTIGSVPEDLKQRPIMKDTQQYFKFLDEIKATENIVNIMTAYYAYYYICGAIYNYLATNPSYTENKLAQLMLFRTIGGDMATEQFRTFIDNRAKEVDSGIEKQLNTTFRSVAGFWLNGINASYQ